MFSNRHAPGRDELRPGVAPVLSAERDARREQGQAVYFQAFEQTKIPCPEPLPASAERGGGGWGRGLARSQARRSAPLGSAAEGKRRGLSGERSRPQLGGTPKTVRGLGGAREPFPLRRGAQRPYLGRGREARSKASARARRRTPLLHSAQASNGGATLAQPPLPPQGLGHRLRRLRGCLHRWAPHAAAAAAAAFSPP